MSKIAYVKQSGSKVVHVSISTEMGLNAFGIPADVHDVTICGQRITWGTWTEAPRPTETGMESDLRRCKKCDRKRIGGHSVDALAFDYEDELAEKLRAHRTFAHDRNLPEA